MDAQISGRWPVAGETATPDGKANMSRWKAAGIHLGISALIAALVLAVIYLVWYPSPYFKAMGGDKLLLLLIGVDVVIGPLITLIIYKAGKKALKFDLGVIAFLQSAALVYGVVVAAEARPVYSVFTGDRFETVAANELNAEELAKAKHAQLRSLSWSGPRVIGAVMPTDPQQRMDIMLAAAVGKDLQHFPSQFVPYTEVSETAAQRAEPIEKLRRYNPGKTALIDRVLSERALKEDQVGFLPVRARLGHLAAIVNRKGELIETLDLNPWQD
jgi:hypothetical protein